MVSSVEIEIFPAKVLQIYMYHLASLQNGKNKR
jgi:hypothetical protein